MKVIVIEDEKPAAGKLVKALQKMEGPIEVMAVLSNILESVTWLQKNKNPDLVFMDINLTDGLSFRIFEKVNLDCPVIFTTAYDEYWQEAFEHNSIDYLLKPIKQDKLEAAIKKYKKLKHHFSSNIQALANWDAQSTAIGYKKRFLVKRASDFISIKTEDIAYFYAAHKLVCMVDKSGHKYILDLSLAEIEKQLDPSMFHRVNRKWLVNIGAIKRIKSFPKSKLQLELEPSITEEIIVSQENVALFKEWMGQ